MSDAGDAAAASWVEVLDALERQLAGATAAADWEAPVGLAPLPDALRSRAIALLARLEAAHAEVTARHEAVGRELAAVRRRAAVTRPARVVDRDL